MATPIGVGAQVKLPTTTLPSTSSTGGTGTTGATAPASPMVSGTLSGPRSFQNLIALLGPLASGTSGQNLTAQQVNANQNLGQGLPSMGDIQAGYEAAIAQQQKQETADLNALMSKAGLSDSTQRLSGLQGIAQQGVIEKGQLAMQLRDLGFNEALQQAQLNLQAGEFNASIALQAQQENIANQLNAIGLDANLIYSDVQFQLQQNAQLNSAMVNYVGAMSAIGSG